MLPVLGWEIRIALRASIPIRVGLGVGRRDAPFASVRTATDTGEMTRIRSRAGRAVRVNPAVGARPSTARSDTGTAPATRSDSDGDLISEPEPEPEPEPGEEPKGAARMRQALAKDRHRRGAHRSTLIRVTQNQSPSRRPQAPAWAARAPARDAGGGCIPAGRAGGKGRGVQSGGGAG